MQDKTSWACVFLCKVFVKDVKKEEGDEVVLMVIRQQREDNKNVGAHFYLSFVKFIFADKYSWAF